MVRIRPFAAVRPQPNHAARVASPPYDVLSTAEAKAIGDQEPMSFLHVIRAEIDLAADVDPHGAEVYEQARRTLERMLRDGSLVREAEPKLYLYRQVRDRHVQVGVVGCCHVDDYASGAIRKHEHTRKDKEDDRTRHVLTLNANTGPVFLTFHDDPEIARLVAADLNHPPLIHFNAPDGVTHTVWPIAEPEPYVRAFSRHEAVYVADGHHRSASAARAGKERAATNPDHRGDEEYNWFMTVLFPAGDLAILPYNRIVRDLNGATSAETLAALEAVGTVRETIETEPVAPGRFCFYLDGRWYELALDPASIDHSDPIRSLDVQLLQDRVLGPILGVGDPGTDRRIDFVGGIRGAGELRRRVDEGDAGIAFALHPTSIEQLLAVADAGLIMPPKSTWFEPKLRSGLFVHELG